VSQIFKAVFCTSIPLVFRFKIDQMVLARSVLALGRRQRSTALVV